MIFKIFWFLSTIIISPFFKSIKLPSYIAFPLFFQGLKNVQIGRKVRIFPKSRIEVHGDGEIIIEDNVGIGQNFHITSAGKLVIGKGTVVSANVFITNIDHSYQEIDKPILEQPNVVKDTIIGDNCFIGIGASIQAGTKLGKQCIVGTNSVVRGEFPDYCVIVGVPAKIVKKYNLETKSWEKYKYEE
ncbi:acyltransferase [Vibrio vulnificus]|uniref:acyltransferase n=1 Tax=Vibrio vulnificus TaxID=672 RepID=UPI0037C32032